MTSPPSAPPEVDPPQAPPGPGEVQWRRLSLRMLVVHPVRELLRLLPVLVGVLFAGRSSGQGGRWGLLGVAVAVGLGLLRWFTTTYRVTPDQVQVRHGILQRRLVSVPLDRVRTVDISASPLHRILGLVRMSIGTGRSDRRGGGELRLDGLSAAAAARLRDELLDRHRGPSRPAVPADEEIARLDPSWIWYGPFTLSGVLTVLVVAGFAWQVVSEVHIDLRRIVALGGGVAGLTRVPWWVYVVVLPVVTLVLVACASTAAYVLAFWGYRLTRRQGGALQVTRGLISTRATTIEERRLRGIEISEPLLLRAVRGARCIAITTGLRVGRGAERGGSLVLPPAPRDEAFRVAADALKIASPSPSAGARRGDVFPPLTRHGPSARRRRYTRALAVCVPVVAVPFVLWRLAVMPAWPWEASLALLPIGAAVAADRYRSLGHAMAGRMLVTSWGSLVRRRCVLACDGIIGWNVDQSFFQRRAGLATLVATTAAGRQAYRIQDVAVSEALRLATTAVPDLLTPFLEPDPEAVIP